MYGKKVMGTERTTVVVGPDGKVERVFPKVKVEGHVATCSRACRFGPRPPRAPRAGGRRVGERPRPPPATSSTPPSSRCTASCASRPGSPTAPSSACCGASKRLWAARAARGGRGGLRDAPLAGAARLARSARRRAARDLAHPLRRSALVRAAAAPPRRTPRAGSASRRQALAPPSPAPTRASPPSPTPSSGSPWRRRSRAGSPSVSSRELGEEEARALARAMNERAPLTVRANSLTGTREALRARLAEEGVGAEPTRFSPWGLVLDGHAERLLARVLPGRAVRDPGRGEPAHRARCRGAAGLDGRGRLRRRRREVARARRRDAQQGLAPRARHRTPTGWRRRSGAPAAPASTTCARGSSPAGAEAGAALADLAGKAERVLVDAPCSGLGTLRRKPDARWRLAPEDPARFAALQRELVVRFAQLLRPGRPARLRHLRHRPDRERGGRRHL